MAHEIEATADGQGHRFVHVGEPAWHKLGTNVEEALTAADAMRLGGQDHTIDKVGPLWVPIPDHIDPKPMPQQVLRVLQDPATGQEYRFVVPREAADEDGDTANSMDAYRVAYSTIRGEDGKILGTVGKGYGVVEPVVAFNLFDKLLEVEGGVKFQSAGVLKGGRWMFLTAKLPKGIKVFGKDTHDLYLFAVNSYDRSLSFTVGLSVTEIVCANTAQAALGNAESFWKLRHGSNVLDSVEEVREQLGLSYQYADTFQEAMERMASTRFRKVDYARMISQLYPDRKGRQGEDTKRQELRQVLTDAWGSTSVDDGLRDTAYGAYSIFTESREWAPAYNVGQKDKRPINSLWIGKDRDEDDVRTTQAWFGNVAADRQEVFDYLNRRAAKATTAA